MYWGKSGGKIRLCNAPTLSPVCIIAQIESKCNNLYLWYIWTCDGSHSYVIIKMHNCFQKKERTCQELNRTDIEMRDVFISWTGKDRALKDTIVKYLEENHISCLESDENCSGDFAQWSKEAVGACSLFLLILTENTLQSQYVPIEVAELKKLHDWKNRVVPVCMNMELYQSYSWGLHESESAVFLEGETLSEAVLADILSKTVKLLIHRQYALYCAQSQKEYATLIPLLGRDKTAAKSYLFDTLYVSRTLTELDEQGLGAQIIDSPKELLKTEDVLFVSGSAGSGKTHYIHQIRRCADTDDLVLSLSCAKTAKSSEDLLGCMFQEFKRIAGARNFYSLENFKRLLSVKHLVLILDGMDEIATKASTHKFMKKVKAFYAANMHHVTLLFTSRNADDANAIVLEGKNTRKFILNKLNDSQISELSGNLFLLFGTAEQANQFYLRAKDVSEEMISNPLLLSQLAIVYQNTGKFPQNVVELYDAISEIILKVDAMAEFDAIPESYKDMLQTELSSILKSFARERYRLLSLGRKTDITKILSKILKDKYGSENKARAEFLVEYLHNRSILLDEEFYHKMFLEYFTAVSYYEQIFDDYDDIENVDTLKELFSHYASPYWSLVIELFLVKADNVIDEHTTNKLYQTIIDETDICEYTLLFESCRHLICHKREAQLVLVLDILKKSVDGIYPPYGPLFWYIPEYELYSIAVLAAEKCLGNAKVLALVRDVCVIFGQVYTVSQITDAVDGDVLYRAANHQLIGVRDALCALFCTGKTTSTHGTQIYPRCFNVAETQHFMAYGHGMFARFSTLFEDELGLFVPESYPELGGEYIGFVSCPYRKTAIEQKLSEKPTAKVRGLALSHTDDTQMDYLYFLRTSVRVLYIPENTTNFGKYFDAAMPLQLLVKMDGDSGIIYLPRHVRKITVPTGTEMVSENAFAGLLSLEEVDLPFGLKTIGNGAFEGCANLRHITIPNSVTDIGTGAFKGCTALSDIVIPDGVKRIKEVTFLGCTSLSRITIPNSVIVIGFGAFKTCTALSDIVIPNSVESIGFGAFSDCINLSRITIPNSVVEIWIGAFEGCTALTNIVLSDSVTKIEQETFKGCTALTDIVIPNSVRAIGRKAFEGCTALQNIVIPDSVEWIEEEAFSGCTALESVAIPSSVKKINPSIFVGCVNLKTIYLPSHLLSLVIPPTPDTEMICNTPVFDTPVFDMPDTTGELYIPHGTTRIYYEEFASASYESVHLPDTVERIGVGAFAYCTHLRHITIPNSVREIGREAFKGCKALSSIVIFDSVIEIGWGAFDGCTALSSIVIPHSVMEIGMYAFYGCTGLSHVTISNSVTEIGWMTFAGCTSLSDVVIPNSVESIGLGAFSGCTSLRHIKIPNSVTTIEMQAFENCTALSDVVIPDSVKKIGLGAFEGCAALSNITIPDSVTEIESSAFEGCVSLSNITLPALLECIPSGIFSCCANLRHITIPDAVKRIGERAFYDCRTLEEVILPEVLEEIEEKAFFGCAALTALRIPQKVKYIGDRAFESCYRLKSVTLSANFKGDVARIFGHIDQSIIEWI